MSTVRNALYWLLLLAVFAVLLYTVGVDNDYIGEEDD